MDSKLRWAILGTGNIAARFAGALRHSRRGVLVAVASRSAANAERFGEAHAVARRYAGYEAMLSDRDVDAVYIATPHPMHAEWAIRCAEAGKHVLCEKPLTLNAAEAMAVIQAARRSGVFLMEAFAYRCHPQTEKLAGLIRDGLIGDVRLIRATFGFHAAYNLEGRVFSNALGGGGILDVGCYAVSMARLIAGVAAGRPFAEPADVQGAGLVGAESRVDEYAAATLSFPGGVIAQVAAGVRLAMGSEVRIYGSEGSLGVPSPWFCSGREGGRSVLILDRRDGASEEVPVETDGWLYAFEADHVAECVAEGRLESPLVSWEDSVGNMKALDRWRESVGVVYDAERPANMKLPVHGRPLSRRAGHRMRYARVPGLDKDISRVVVGAFAQHDYRLASVMFDDFVEQGGNCLDTARTYGPMEGIVGQWMSNRGVREDIVLITKGAHTPRCDPENMTRELMQSLDQLRTDYVDVYFLHRDNPDIPVGEFVDALNEHKRGGRVKLFGGSNWSLRRVYEANEYAGRHGLTGFGAISNNFSLARMVEPVWPGCLSSSDAESRRWLPERQMPLFAWSSQARGFFVEGRAAPDRRSDPELVRGWYSDDNFERLRRAGALAKELGVRAVSVALAYVLCQPFPLFPIIGPLSPHETWTSMAALDVDLSPEQLRWLNLEG